jgi:C1A family cysteine protease
MAFSTYGELRQQLEAEGIKWTVNPAFSDSTPITRPGLGADLAKFPKAKDIAPVDVASLVKTLPTTNTFLRAHLVTRGLLPASARAIGGSSQTGATAASGGAGGSGGSLPTSVDWRNRWTWNYVTGIRDQDPCEHCWIYASTALVECMVRIEHCIWCDRSEGDYIEANKVPCGQCGDPADVLNWFASNGVCGQDCVSWVDSDPGNRTSTYWNPWPGGCGGGSMLPPPAYNPPTNRNGKTVKIPAYTALGDNTAEKNWIDAIGPLVVAMDIYSDFFGWSGNVPYTKSATATYEGSHIMLAVGYDDNLQCWIVKNSWGTGYGNGGFYLIAYGQCNIDANSKLGFQYSNPDPWTKRRSHSGGMIESGDGALHRNFELLAPSSANSFTHWWRDNSSATMPWAKAETMANDVASALTHTGTTYNRNFETVYRTLNSQLHHWYFEQTSGKWNNGPIFGPSNTIGGVGFCESNFGIGNFEIVVAVQGGTMEHWFRSGNVWAKSVTFGSGVLTAGPSLLQSTYGNLEFVATLGNGQMQHWWRNGSTWIGDQLFGSGVASPACMIQGQFGADTDSGNGNFELCVAMPNGTVQHWWRNNQASSFPWAMSTSFGSGVREVVSLLQGSFGFNLELIVLRSDGMLQHYYRDDGGWHAAEVIGTTL